MKSLKIVFAASFATFAFSTAGLAQGVMFTLPEKCSVAAQPDAMDHAAMGHGSVTDVMDVSGMPEHVQENMNKMRITMPAMEQGMMNEDADVAFACGMIAHHQGAIDMAQVLLDHGDDLQMRALAQEIMDAQVAEIQQMTQWLSKQGK
jgi:uncharacterized protein (DUF305 family)